MLNLPDIRNLAHDVARGLFPGQRVESISVEPRVGAFGDDLLWIDLVIDSSKPNWPDGEAIVAFMGEIQERLEQLGDDRQPIIHILTPTELAADLEALAADVEPES